MASSSPYRFTIQTDAPEEAPRSRVGLSSITSGGGSAGGEGYRASALRPGSSGYMAATFGGAPRTDYVRPTTTATMTATPTATQTAAPTLAPEYGGGAFGAEGGSGQTGDGTGFDAGGKPGEMGDLGINFDGKTVGGLLGGALGGLALGPLGGLAGAVAGRALGAGISPGPQAAPEIGGAPDAQHGGAHEASQAASANPNNGIDVAGDFGKWAEGGQVPMTPAKGNPMDNKPKDDGMRNKAKGLSQVQGFGGFAVGGHVPNYADGGPVDGAGLAGPNPPGPDDGFAALDGGEYVVQAQQAQRPDYASILQQINQGTYQPEGDGMGDMGGASTDGTMPAEGSAGADPSSLPPMMQQALGQAVTADPMLAQALTSLLGPEAVNEIMACCGGMGMGEGMAGQGAHETPFGRPPLAGPKPPPGINSPPGVRPPPAANPMMPMPPPMGGLRGIAA